MSLLVRTQDSVNIFDTGIEAYTAPLTRKWC